MRKWIVHGILAEDDEAEVWLNLHDYSTETALLLVHDVIETGWLRGMRRVTLVHGAAEISSPAGAYWSGRGATKWALRRALNAGEFKPYVYHSRSERHHKPVYSNRITLALKPNPTPQVDADWPEVSAQEY